MAIAIAMPMGMAAVTSTRTGCIYTQAFTGRKPCCSSKQQRGMKLYCNSSQQLSSTPLVLENLAEHAILLCRCNAGSLNRHIRHRTIGIRSPNRNIRGRPFSGGVSCIAGDFGSKTMAMLRSKPLQEHGRSLSKLFGGSRFHYNKGNAYFKEFGQPRICPVPLSALQDKTLIMPGRNLVVLTSKPLQEHGRSPSKLSGGLCLRYDKEKTFFRAFGHHRVCPHLSALQDRSFVYLPVCRGRYLSKDTISVDESEVLQTDNEAENFEEVGFDGLKENASEEDLEKKRRMEQFVVVNFYHFVDIEDAHLEVAKHMQYMQGKDIHGRIYINNQGVNAQLSGLPEEALAYADWVKQDSRFVGLLVQVSPSPKGHAFPRLQLRYKPSLVQVEGGTASLPLTNDQLRAVPLKSHEWKEKLLLAASLEAGDSSSAIGNVSTKVANEGAGKVAFRSTRKVLLLDVRNGYEWDVGHFEGALRPDIDCFKNTKFGLSDTEMNVTDPLEGVDKNDVEVLMYCTGGIRCDVYSVILRQKGFRHLYSLKGGVSQYLKEQGPQKWVGNLFVFDSRLAIPPFSCGSATSIDHYEDEDMSSRREKICDELAVSSNLDFAKCKLCGEEVTQIRHRNCANLDCNCLYLSCVDCVDRYKGCCSGKCTNASRLRPVLSSEQSYDRYERWHKYRLHKETTHGEILSKCEATQA
ncbi:hypothetical protein O6H91_09G007400 [Diphasiastrum complanatum]|uniref:Uncharacterized protein n=1 Tax=Diphasiastrum complanatum TaxID=34168 RepID=A0ACC2CLW7_DIPCM|nr:hypothetical protein O6H91_09G007400 [Diphasiastrum complanatum]